MGLANGSSRARNYSQTVNQNQGGGNKKAGFPYQIGRGSWSSISLGCTAPLTGNCCSLSDLSVLHFTKVSQSRPVGGSVTIPYWNNV